MVVQLHYHLFTTLTDPKSETSDVFNDQKERFQMAL